MLRYSVPPLDRIFSNPTTAIPPTFLVSVCIAELKDSVHRIQNTVYILQLENKMLDSFKKGKKCEKKCCKVFFSFLEKYQKSVAKVLGN